MKEDKNSNKRQYYNEYYNVQLYPRKVLVDLLKTS